MVGRGKAEDARHAIEASHCLQPVTQRTPPQSRTQRTQRIIIHRKDRFERVARMAAECGRRGCRDACPKREVSSYRVVDWIAGNEPVRADQQTRAYHVRTFRRRTRILKERARRAAMAEVDAPGIATLAERLYDQRRS